MLNALAVVARGGQAMLASSKAIWPKGPRGVAELLTKSIVRSCLLVVFAAAFPVHAQTGDKAPNNQAAVRMLWANSYEIGYDGEKLTGAGATILLSLARNSQFVAIGEEHNSADIPPFITALFAQLHALAGYNYLAEEQDAAITRIVSVRGMRGNFKALVAQAQREKHSFTFDSDEELKMLAAIGSISTAKGRPIWGCEQVFGATHILRRILPAAPSPSARKLVANLLVEARRREEKREADLPDRFLMDPRIATQMPRLIELYETSRSPEARTLAGLLARSFEIYHYYWNGDHGLSPGYYANNAVREEHMKSLCRDEYVRSATLDGRLPRAILKFGHWHLFQGLSPGEIPTTGSFFADVASFNKLGFVSIAFLSKEYGGTPLWADADSAGYKAFAEILTTNSWRLVDLRPFREYGAYRDLEAEAGSALSSAAKRNLRQLVYGFDFAIIKPSGRSAHFTLRQRD